MILIIAWRNIWRNKLRSLVLMLSIALGLWAGVFVLAFAWGMYKSNISDTIYRQLSHVQVHHTAFKDESLAKYTVDNTTDIVKVFRSSNQVQSIAARVITNGMIASPIKASGVRIIGIVPNDEAAQIKLNEYVTEGGYFTTAKRNEILIGEKLAKKLKVKLKSKMVLTFTNTNLDIVSAAFKVSGIYRSHNTSLDEQLVYVQQPYLRELLDLDSAQTHEIAILLKNEDDISFAKSKLEKLVSNARIEDWHKLAPELDLVISSFNMYMYIIIGIILLALTFGIVNTMLMAVLERVRELGMLMAIGMNKRRVFTMIMLETFLLSLVGSVIGLVIAKLTVSYLGTHGVNLSMFSEGLSGYGFSAIIYPEIDNNKYYLIAAMSLLTAFVASIYPAIKALQLNPSEAIRKI